MTNLKQCSGAIYRLMITEQRKCVDGLSHWMGNWMYIAQVPLNNALVLGNLHKYRHNRYIAKN